MNKQRLFVASCISLVTTAMMFAIRGDIEAAMSGAFHLTKEQMGLLWGPAFYGFSIGIIICGLVVDVVGMKTLHLLSALGYIGGILAFFFAPKPDGPIPSIFSHVGTTILFVGFLAMGISQGIVEGVINPLVATMYNEEKTKKLNFLHAWWPGGIVIGGLAAFMLSKIGASWQVKLGLILVPAVVYLFLVLRETYPKTERVTSNVTTGEMAKEAFNPLFILLFICMWMTAATELGPNQWLPSVMKDVGGIESGGILFLVLTAGVAFVLRFFFGGVVHKFSPFGVMAACSVLGGLGLLWLGSLGPTSGASSAVIATLVFGIGTTYYWPTMLGVTSERFPKGGAFLMNLMGGAGMLSIALVLPVMGAQFDKLGPGAALRAVAVLPAILLVVFGGLYLGFRAKGGYKAIKLDREPAPAGKRA